MKKEIKKLQRFRDQVKQWAASNDVKDKNPLLEARRRIEGEMERFKVIEKETKTKAFSKEGLAAARVAKDPKEKAKDEARDWITNAIEEMNTQIETFESEIDSLTSSSKKKSSRGGSGNSRLTHLEESMSRHHQHIARLELCARLVDDDALSPTDAEDLKDLVEDYLERNQEDFDEFAEPEDIYADLDLDDLEDVAARNKEKSVNIAAELALAAARVDGGEKARKTTEKEKASGVDAANERSLGKDEDATHERAKELSDRRDGVKARPSEPAPSSKKPIPAPVGKAGVLGGGAGLPAPLGLKHDGDGGGGKAIPGPKGAAAAREGALGGSGGSWGAPDGAAADGVSGLQQQQSWSFPPAGGDGASGTGSGGGTGAAHAAPQTPQTPQTPPAPGMSKFPLPVPGRGQQAQARGGAGAGSPQTQPGAGGSLSSGSGSPGGKGLPAPLTFPKNVSGGHAHGPQKDGGGDTPGSVDETAGEASDALAPPPALAELLEETARDARAGDAAPRFATRGVARRESRANDGSSADGASTTDEPSSTGGLPVGVSLGGLTHHDPAVRLRLLEAARRHAPRAADGAWSAARREKPSVPIPASYPTSAPPVLENPALFERLDADALFFTFYYQQGTARQYLAARELKRANWRFHKTRGAWFARREEPKASTDLYEQGSYIYFDFSSSDNAGAAGGWCQRSKPDFVFHYSQLESELV